MTKMSQQRMTGMSQRKKNQAEIHFPQAKVFHFFAVDLSFIMKKNMGKSKAGSKSKLQFNEIWENEFLFIATPSGKPLCIVSESNLSDYRSYDLSRHDEKHRAEVEEKHKLEPDSKLRKENVVKKKEDITNRQNLFIKKHLDSLAMLEASYDIVFVLAKRYKPCPDGEVIVNPSLENIA